MAVAVHEVNIYDSKGAPKVIEKPAYKFPKLVKVLADRAIKVLLVSG